MRTPNPTRDHRHNQGDNPAGTSGESIKSVDRPENGKGVCERLNRHVIKMQEEKRRRKNEREEAAAAAKAKKELIEQARMDRYK